MSESLIDFYSILKTSMKTPAPRGGFHVFCLIITLLTAMTLVRLFSDASERTVRIITFVFWGVILVFELLKQFSCGFSLVDGKLVLSYPWSIFPYQFCSTPLYVLPILIFAKDGKLRDTAIVFLSTFAFIGGAAIYIAPDSVFTSNLFLNVQTMLHHGIQAFLGLYLAFRYSKKLTLSGFARATAMFLALSGIALIINVVTYNIFPLLGISDVLNMFFISPYKRHVPKVLAGLGIESIPYGIYLISYLTVFILAAFLIMLIMKRLERQYRYDL